VTRAIDYLCNHFTPESISKNYLTSENRSSMEAIGRIDQLEGVEPAERFVADLTGLGVEKILVTAIVTWSFHNQRPLEYTSPEEVIELTTQFPDRVFGLYGVNPFRRMEGVRELESLVREHGFKGMHLHPHGFGFPPNHPFYFPFYAKCEELGVPAVVSMGHTLDLMPIENGRPAYLDEVALYFDNLKIVCGHTGWPWVEEAIALASKHPNVFLGTSAYAPRYWKPEMVQFLNSSRGRGKVLWGTDWPIVKHGEALQQIEALNLREESKRLLLYDTAARLFFPG
jgi:predicted TIM-barrel fold metal-dependent hydrolase